MYGAFWRFSDKIIKPNFIMFDSSHSWGIKFDILRE